MLAMGKTAWGKWMPRRGLLMSRKGTEGVMLRSLKWRRITSQKYALRKPSHSCAHHTCCVAFRLAGALELYPTAGPLRKLRHCLLSYGSRIDGYLAAGQLPFLLQEKLRCLQQVISIALDVIRTCHPLEDIACSKHYCRRRHPLHTFPAGSSQSNVVIARRAAATLLL